MNKNNIKGAIIGAILGDIIGVPFEFKQSFRITKEDILEFKGYQSHNVPFGYWSDDSSLILATMDSIKNKKYSLKTIGNNFCEWLFNGRYTTDGKVFDCGTTVRRAINQMQEGNFEGRNNDFESGNGSLMRILPIVIFEYFNQEDENKAFENIKKVGNITHSNSLCEIGCAIYTKYIFNLLSGMNKIKAYEDMQKFIRKKYKNKTNEMFEFKRILKEEIYSCDNIFGDGYIISTLESSLWSFINSNSYSETIIESIKLGGDTDTITCISGGLAGLYYGFENINKEWIEKISNKDYILKIYNSFEKEVF